jgi:PAS domain S-box-containing protein
MPRNRSTEDEDILRLNRQLDVLGQLTRVIVRAGSREELLNAVCRVLVERGALDLARISWLDVAGAEGVPAASCGQGSDLLGPFPFAAEEPSGEHGTPSCTVRAGQPFVCNNCGSEGQPCLLPPAVAEFGFRSCSLFPLRLQGQVRGALTLCAREPQRFREREAATLLEMAGNISFALDGFEAESQRARAEETLREAYKAASDIVDRMPAGLFLYDYIAPDRLYLKSGNPEAERLTGLRITDWIGREFNEIWPAARRAGITDYFLAALRENTVFETEDLEYRDERLTGAFRIRAFPLPDNRLAVAFENITERKRVETALRDSEALMSRAEELSDMGSFIWDLASDTLTWSRGLLRLVGWEPVRAATTLRETMAQLLHPDDKHRVQDEIARMIATRRTWPIEGRIIRSDGAERLWQSVAEFILDEQGAPRRCVVIFRDVTQRQADESRLANLQSQLNHTSRLAVMGEMVAEIAHELNQPLCSIGNFANACRNLASTPSCDLNQVREWSTATATAAGRAGDIVQRLLRFARKQEQARIMIGLRQLVQDALLLIRHEAQSRRVSVEVELPEEEVTVHAHPVQIEQVLVNLLRNSIEAFPDDVSGKRHVAIHATRRADAVQISVVDNGAGLPETELHGIFEPFFTTKPQGLGLGLPISRTIITDHGGDIWGTVNPSGGLSIHFTLPLAGESHEQ